MNKKNGVAEASDQDILSALKKFVCFSNPTQSISLFEFNNLNINSNNNVIKYDISINSPSLIPIYDANFPYDIMTERSTALFNLNEYPPKNLTLSFSSSTKYTIKIDIIAYIQVNSNQFHL